MADLGTTYGASGKSSIEKSSGENSSLIKVTSESSDNIFIIDNNTFTSTSVDSIDSNLGDIIPNTSTTYFIMRGKDVDCVGTVYRFWTVTGSPDTDASEYAGVKCGISSLQDIIVVFKYTQ